MGMEGKYGNTDREADPDAWGLPVIGAVNVYDG